MYRTLTGKNIENIAEYVRSYIAEHDNIHILIGCDSQNYSRDTVYVTAIVLYNEGHGGHVIFEREREPRERVRATRLMNEVWRSIAVANTLKEAGLPNPDYIDIDVNPNPRWKSNEVFESAKGLVEGMGYKCRYKTLGVIATCCADYIVRS